MQISHSGTAPTPNLFRSQAWLDAWRHGWGELLDDSIPKKHQPINYFSCGKLSAYSYDSKFLDLFRIRTIYPEGKTSKLIPAIRNEYFQFPFDPVDCDSNWDEFWSTLDAKGWDRVIFDDILKGSVDHLCLLDQAAKRGLFVLNRGEDPLFGIDTAAQDFTGYLKGLSTSSRIKLYNKRSKLRSMGVVAINNMCQEPDGFFRLLNDFHAVRWGKRCFSPNNQKMINLLLDNSSDKNLGIDCSVMSIDNTPVSAVFDLHYGNRIYNLQMGYNESLSKGISLGALHLGYQIEAAFNNPVVDYYDLMAGCGKHCSYKESFSDTRGEFVNLVVFKRKWMPVAHRLKDHLREFGERLRVYSVKQ